MISMSSLLSLSDPYGSRELDFKRNAGKRLSLRSGEFIFVQVYDLLTYKTIFTVFLFFIELFLLPYLP